MDESIFRGIFLWKKVVAVVRPLIDRKECILLPASLVCGNPKVPHKFTSLFTMLEFPYMPASIVFRNKINIITIRCGELRIRSVLFGR